MQEQQQQSLYQPINFVYTHTIGSHLKQTPSQTYDWKYHDILIPKPLASQSAVFYYLFHVAPVYNWLRGIDNFCYQREELRRYILKESHCPKDANLISLAKIEERIVNYSRKWQIIKLCIKNKVFIKNSSKCKHMLKTQQWSQLFNYDYKIQDFYCSTIYCKECCYNVEVSCQIKQRAFAPIFHKFFGKQINVNGEKYVLFLCYTNQNVYVKASNQIFYLMSRSNPRQSNQVKMKICSNFKIDKSTQGLFCYMKQSAYKDCGIMKNAVILKQINNNPSVIFKQNINHEEHSEQKDENQYEQKLIRHTKGSIQQIQSKNKKKKLAYLRKQHTQVILPQQQLQNPQIKHYKNEIQKLFFKPKEKDDYQKQYDQGKTKKIKKKVDYYKPNFNEIFNRLKKQAKEGGDQGSGERHNFRQQRNNQRGFKRNHRQFSSDKKFHKDRKPFNYYKKNDNYKGNKYAHKQRK